MNSPPASTQRIPCRVKKNDSSFYRAAANSRVYYLEDAMGSVIGLVSNGVSIARFTYDGFGKQRNAFGTSTNALGGTGGDFGFHGQLAGDEH